MYARWAEETPVAAGRRGLAGSPRIGGPAWKAAATAMKQMKRKRARDMILTHEC